MPPLVAAELTRRLCMIPQSFEARQPENVIHGAFHAPGSSDWAVLCSTGGVTTLYVFFAGQFEAPIALRSQPDSTWLGAEPGGPGRRVHCPSVLGVHPQPVTHAVVSSQI